MEALTRVFFPTGSHFKGIYEKNLYDITDFGTYHYPYDACRYRGLFLQGKFHGPGELRLGKPYNLTLHGEFVEGNLVQIKDVVFDDRLVLPCHFIGGMLLTRNWNYCTSHDRRYVRDLLFGLGPISSHIQNVTSVLPSRKIEPLEYDNEEGVLTPSNFMTKRSPPLDQYRFVGSQSEQYWIRKHCRVGDEKETQIDKETCLEILKANLQSVKENENAHICDCKIGIEHYNYVNRLCNAQIQKALGVETPDTHDINQLNSSCTTSISSFGVDSQSEKIENIEKDIEEEQTHKSHDQALTLLMDDTTVNFQGMPIGTGMGGQEHFFKS